MRGKLVFATGVVVGYVFGTRAGRRRYEQIKANAQKVWSSSTVQRGVEQVQTFVDDHSPDVPAVIADGAKKVIDKVAASASSKSGQTGTSSAARRKPSNGAAGSSSE